MALVTLQRDPPLMRIFAPGFLAPSRIKTDRCGLKRRVKIAVARPAAPAPTRATSQASGIRCTRGGGRSCSLLRIWSRRVARPFEDRKTPAAQEPSRIERAIRRRLNLRPLAAGVAPHDDSQPVVRVADNLRPMAAALRAHRRWVLNQRRWSMRHHSQIQSQTLFQKRISSKLLIWLDLCEEQSWGWADDVLFRHTDRTISHLGRAPVS